MRHILPREFAAELAAMMEGKAAKSRRPGSRSDNAPIDARDRYYPELRVVPEKLAARVAALKRAFFKSGPRNGPRSGAFP